MGLLALLVGLFLAVAAVAAQPPAPARTAHVSVLIAGSSTSGVKTSNAFRERLQELGWIEGKNLVLDFRYAENRYDRLPALAAEVVAARPDVIFAVAAPAIRAAMQATSTIPIVIETLGDAVTAGVVADLARPGGNVTGVSGFAPELSGKRLQIIREILARADVIGVLANLANPTTPSVIRAIETAARQLPAQVHVSDVRRVGDLAGAFDRMERLKVDAVVVVSDPMIHGASRQLVQLAERHRLPTVYEQRQFPDEGGLLSYGPARLDRFQRAAVYVDRILKGAKPAELPLERPTKFELVVNLKAARKLGLAIPQSVLVQADDVIQ